MDTRVWMKEQRLRSHLSFDTATWSVSDIFNALDILELRWYELESLDHHIFLYLDAMEFRAAWFIAHTATKEYFDIRKHRLKVDDNEYQLHPAIIYKMYVRFVSIRRSFAQYTMFDTVPPVKDMPETRWADFVQKETRHLTIRKFRDGIATITWEHMMRLSRLRTRFLQRTWFKSICVPVFGRKSTIGST